MNERQAKLLAAIIDQFIETAVPVGSKQLLEHANFCLSCATVRNEMRVLGDEGYLEQPHISAGRVPTAKGYKIYVKQFMEPSRHESAVLKKFGALKEQYLQRKDQERVCEAVTLLSRLVPHVAFATVPHKHQSHFLGLANVLKQPEFQSDPSLASGVVEVLEQKLIDLMEAVDVDDKVHYLIGGEHLLPQIQSCSLLVTTRKVRDQRVRIGVMGPMRMDYAYNTAALEMVADLLHSD